MPQSSSDLLAIDGGPKSVTGPIPEWPLPSASIRNALMAAFEEGRWGRYHGDAQEKLRHRLCTLSAQDHAWLCSSGTIAVEMALRACRIGPDDEVILAGYDFPGNFRAIEAVGARPVLCDVVPSTWCLNVEQAEDAIGPQTKAIVASHLHGGQVDIRHLRALADEHDLKLIEDACQCPGASVAGRPAGAWGDVGVFSFGGSKLLSAGRGGALVTSNAAIAQRIKLVAERGNDAYPLSELQASVLLPQLDGLALMHQIRLASAIWICEQIGSLRGLATLDFDPEQGSPAFYKFPLRIEEGAAPIDRSRVIAALQAEGVSCDIGFRGFGKRSKRRCRVAFELHEANRAAEQTILLHHPTLIAEQKIVEETVAGIHKVAQVMLEQ